MALIRPLLFIPTQGGAEEIKSHPFFDSINWALIRMEKAPHVLPNTASSSPGKKTEQDTVFQMDDVS